MDDRRKAFADTLKRFDFGKHRAHRWLLLVRARREELLREAGLLDFVRWQDEPVHLGNIARVNQRFDWGFVVFQGALKYFHESHPCSVYAAFEHLICECGHFPSFIAVSDLVACGNGERDSLPVFGSALNLNTLSPSEKAMHINKLLALHGITKHRDPLIWKPCEVSDSELFDQYFREISEGQKEESEVYLKDFEETVKLDDIDIWHT